jgi:uncharacterized protein YdeI (YjbR/CyaY-like superfamily)
VETFYTADRRAWRRWLRSNHKIKTEIWLVYYRKGSGRPRLRYNDAVEEALCFGWIDSTVRKLDDRRFAQRFSPRKPRSSYSQANQERLKELVAAGKVTKDVLVSLGEMLKAEAPIPADILRAIKRNKKAWENFQQFSDSYRRIRIAFIYGARRRPAEFRKRLNYFIKMSAANRQFGFGGIEKYY